MSEPIETESKPEGTKSGASSVVLLCRRAYFETYNESIKKGAGPYGAEKDAGERFRSLMPTIDDKEDIPDFIGCVAEGVLLEVFDPATAGRLLYAAQVASQAVRRVKLSL
ncbi:MAG: hypothetical protein KGN79_14470 [Acidobacteriota bacterium]|nr:hypothetical protein [Acidobacteriota bacterium]